MQSAVSSALGLSIQQAQSLLLAVAVLAVVIIPQFLFGGCGTVDKEAADRAAAAYRERQLRLAKRIKEVVKRSARALGHSTKSD